MNGCESVRNLLDDLLDGTLDRERAAEVETHLADCPDCAGEAAALRRLLDGAASLRVAVEPERDLWPRVRSRLGVPAAGASAGSGTPYRAWAWASTAAAAVLAVALLASLAIDRRSDPVAHGTVPPSAEVGTNEAVLAALSEAERDYRVSRDELLARLDERRDELDPDTVRIVLDNLEIMDRAAREIRLALEDDPADAGLRRLLLVSYRKRLDLLRKAGDVPALPGTEEERT